MTDSTTMSPMRRLAGVWGRLLSILRPSRVPTMNPHEEGVTTEPLTPRRTPIVLSLPHTSGPPSMPQPDHPAAVRRHYAPALICTCDSPGAGSSQVAEADSAQPHP